MRSLHDELVYAVIEYLDSYNKSLGRKLREHKASGLRRQLKYIADLAKIRMVEVQVQRVDRSKAGISSNAIDDYNRKVNEFKKQKQRKELGERSS